MKNKLMIIILALTLTSCSYSEGHRVGTITKFSKKGFIFKTWEGEIATYAKGQASTRLINSFSFSVPDNKVALKIAKLMESGHKVAIKYEEQFFISFWWEGDTMYHIVDAKIVKENN